MNKPIPVTTLFLDIGGVILSNGWGHDSRRLAVEKFNLNLGELEDRHQLTFVTYEEGKLTLKEYLNRVVFYRKRTFTHDQFQKFMFDQSTAYSEMIEYMRKVKELNHLKIAVVNNEARELNEHRIKKFQLNKIVDFYISSCFVHFRKPDADIFRIALDIAQVPAEQVLYIENTQMFVDVARGLGIRSILHTDFKSTQSELALHGLMVLKD